MKYDKECEWCGKEFIALRKDKKYCQNSCKTNYNKYSQLVLQSRNIISNEYNGNANLALTSNSHLNRLMAAAIELQNKHKGKIEINVL